MRKVNDSTAPLSRLVASTPESNGQSFHVAVGNDCGHLVISGQNIGSGDNEGGGHARGLGGSTPAARKCGTDVSTRGDAVARLAHVVRSDFLVELLGLAVAQPNVFIVNQ